jgi:hypothetical protein
MSDPEIFISMPCRLDVNYGLRKRHKANRAWHNRTDQQAELDMIDPACRSILAKDFAKSGVIVGRGIEG